MEQVKTGRLIRQFRTEMNLTQKQLAQRIHVSDKAISKWECGNGYPDIALLYQLADLFGTDIQVLLSGEMDKNEKEKGNMEKTKFYVCKECGNIITSSSETAVVCCGNRLSALKPQKAESRNMLRLEDIGGEWFVSSDHTMTKEHHISFVAYVNHNSMMMYKQYPEWNVQFTIPLYRSGRLVWYCTQCGLFYQDIPKKTDTQK